MASTTKVSLKILIDTKNNKVLFAEAGKEFVDFLFNFLSLPVGTVIRLLTKNGMVGCLGNLYSSIENLSETYMQPNQDKDFLLKPRPPIISATSQSVPLLLSDIEDGDYSGTSRKLYMCPSYHRNVADHPRAVCPSCNNYMNQTVPYIAPKNNAKGGHEAILSGGGVGDEGGFVKGLVTYMVMDDLVVEPMSTISSITLFNKFNIKEVGSLEEKVVHIGMDEGLKLLQASLQSKTVLTNVFLGNVRA